MFSTKNKLLAEDSILKAQVIMDLIEKYLRQFNDHQKTVAASIRSLIFCGELIKSQKIKNILDAGSGLSSVFFHSNFDRVLTIDDNPFWSGKTKEFILKYLERDIEIGTIDSLDGKRFDFVFYDYGNIETRIFNFRKALELGEKFIYIDDMHVIYYRDYVRAKSRKFNLRFLPETVDEYGRFGALIIK